MEQDYEKPVFVQPKMRFKPRTDLERIIETVNTQSYGRIGKSILYKQLKDLELNIVKKTHINQENMELHELIKEKKKKKVKKIEEEEEEEEYNELNIPQITQEMTETNNKNKLLNKRKKVNSDAKTMMSDLHLKTHFKAASVFSLQGCNNS